MSNITIETTGMHFDYNEKTTVFEDHFLRLSVPENQPNKLFGIIGPSGTGKTTLVSILGGQLKPKVGQVLINQTDIYAVSDKKRRELIAMQLQTATSLRASLRYNLLFGLEQKSQETQVYTDDYLVEVLHNVGLWSLFEPKDGLETLIGEGGLNLSGGQRQRLNFAGLYLRSKYFQPKLILIDEPTSSLDEISELAITKMILELTEIGVGLVVAHRLKTLDQAAGLLDSSLFAAEKEIKFYSRKELQNKSKYYQDLMAGKAQLDE